MFLKESVGFLLVISLEDVAYIYSLKSSAISAMLLDYVVFDKYVQRLLLSTSKENAFMVVLSLETTVC